MLTVCASKQGTSDAPFHAELQRVARLVAKSRHIAVVAGAGISTSAGIPDFRSDEGIFRTLLEQNPKAGLSSGKDLFSASLFANAIHTKMYYQLIAELYKKSEQATPTAFHRLLKSLDDQGKLFRVYTQNIDALEGKAGLSFGLGDREEKEELSKNKRVRLDLDENVVDRPLIVKPLDTHVTPTKTRQKTPRSSPSKKKIEYPKCVPLHGTLQTLTCTKCSHVEPLNENSYLTELEQGLTIPCPSCQTIEDVRRSGSKRSRGIGFLKPSVVLYGESETSISDAVGRITEKDLMTTPRPDLLIVAGTSLKVPGTKRLVRELGKVINPALSLGATTVQDWESLRDVKVVFINFHLPSGNQWPAMFDIFVQADIQVFAEAVSAEHQILVDESKARNAEKLDMQKLQEAVEISPMAKGAIDPGAKVKAKKPSWVWSEEPHFNKVSSTEGEILLDRKRERKAPVNTGHFIIELSPRRKSTPKKKVRSKIAAEYAVEVSPITNHIQVQIEPLDTTSDCGLSDMKEVGSTPTNTEDLIEESDQESALSSLSFTDEEDNASTIAETSRETIAETTQEEEEEHLEILSSTRTKSLVKKKVAEMKQTIMTSKMPAMKGTRYIKR